PLAFGASVGRGGKNRPEDVLAVQKALNKRLDAGLSEDGKCDGKALAAIEDFQKRLGPFKPSGFIEPGPGAAPALANSAKLGPAPEPPRPIAPPSWASHPSPRRRGPGAALARSWRPTLRSSRKGCRRITGTNTPTSSKRSRSN